MTVLVGPNRSGTSNLVWALAVALDANLAFQPSRDLPRRRGTDADPKVVIDAEVARPDPADAGHAVTSRATTTVRFDVHRGARSVTATGSGDDRPDPCGHVVLSRVGDTPRDANLHAVRAGLLDLEDPDERAVLEAAITARARAVVPEVEATTLDGRGVVVIVDDLGSSLPVPMARPLAAMGLVDALVALDRRPAALIVESPEAFLHPAAQEAVAGELLALARATAVHVVATVTSPFAVPRDADARLIAVARDAAGRTGVVGHAAGDAPQARLLGGLLRDGGLASVFDRLAIRPSDTRAVLIVEGGTDEAYLRQVATVLDREQVLADVTIHAAGGAMSAAAAAIVLRAESSVPLLVLLDHDEPGRRARDTLVSRFGFPRTKVVLTYADVFDGHPEGVEAETLFDLAFLRHFAASQGRGATRPERRVHGLVHVPLTSSGKSAFVGWMREHADPSHLQRWNDLLDLLETQLPPRT